MTESSSVRLRVSDHPACLAVAKSHGGTILVTGDLPLSSAELYESYIESLIRIGVAKYHYGKVMLIMPCAGTTSFVDHRFSADGGSPEIYIDNVTADHVPSGIAALRGSQPPTELWANGRPSPALVEVVSGYLLKIDHIIRPAYRIVDAAVETYIRLVLGWPQPTYHHVETTTEDVIRFKGSAEQVAEDFGEMMLNIEIKAAIAEAKEAGATTAAEIDAAVEAAMTKLAGRA